MAQYRVERELNTGKETESITPVYQGDKIKWFRNNITKNSLRQAAREIPIDKSVLSAIENNKLRATHNNLTRLATYFGVPVEELEATPLPDHLIQNAQRSKTLDRTRHNSHAVGSLLERIDQLESHMASRDELRGLLVEAAAEGARLALKGQAGSPTAEAPDT